MVTSTLLLTVFLGALVSGWHCALMCGGVAAAIEKGGNPEKSRVIPIKRVTKRPFIYEQLSMHASPGFGLDDTNPVGSVRVSGRFCTYA